MSHSKRNTSRAVFTSYERDLARKAWGSNTARLGRESFLAFSACRLCLETTVDPVACTHGDLFCRECALSNILAQKKEIRRLERACEQEEREARERQTLLDAEAHERAVREFEMTQNGLDVRSREQRSGSSSKLADETEQQNNNTKKNGSKSEAEKNDNDDHNNNNTKKRKFEIDDDALERIAAADRAKARKAIEDEKAASKPNLPSFWVPAVTPASNTRDVLHEVVKKTKTTPVCPASTADRPHTYSLHSLVSVHFTEDDDDKSSPGKRRRTRICPSCKKVLGNSSKAKLAKPCGHVICGSCVDKFMRPSGSKHDPDPHASGPDDPTIRCYVCDADLTDRATKKEGGGKSQDKDKEKGKKKEKEKDKIRPGLVELRSEGTGYSAGGANEVRKVGVGSFQC